VEKEKQSKGGSPRGTSEMGIGERGKGREWSEGRGKWEAKQGRQHLGGSGEEEEEVGEGERVDRGQ